MNSIDTCWTTFKEIHKCSVDRMVCDPALRRKFLDVVCAQTNISDERHVLWTVMNSRKAKRMKDSRRETGGY